MRGLDLRRGALGRGRSDVVILTCVSEFDDLPPTCRYCSQPSSGSLVINDLSLPHSFLLSLLYTLRRRRPQLPLLRLLLHFPAMFGLRLTSVVLVLSLTVASFAAPAARPVSLYSPVHNLSLTDLSGQPLELTDKNKDWRRQNKDWRRKDPVVANVNKDY